ncbi:NAD(P)H-dependent oxidoreductase [Micromonospora sp. PLK6-60]|uniref:NAD(P)H-dependent oxidoreductase n=1 Tax=Micromonospora sp. PLK6-60 TaxID=2873383 RepID=UPI001CA73EB9|nr:NAD(P)H-dependent oxidoreductase [Micromonospora sp. PLK6-60]MBY8870284.1 NAD(P)H-dependent oxidoreductase [Micromonospora sp. PLK6-60]
MTGGAAPTPEVVVLVGNPRAGSRTRGVAEAVTAALLDRLGGPPGPVQVLELAEIVGVSFGPEPAYGARSGPDPFTAVRSARLLVVATPAYKGSFTGLLKVFLDQFGHRELAEVTAVPVAVAAAPPHADAAAAALRDVLVELGAQVPAPPLAVLESRLADADEIATQWADRHATAVAPRPARIG